MITDEPVSPNSGLPEEQPRQSRLPARVRLLDHNGVRIAFLAFFGAFAAGLLVFGFFYLKIRSQDRSAAGGRGLLRADRHLCRTAMDCRRRWGVTA
jgi:hypothetical protein